MNESKLNDRMFHLMESGFFGKQLLSEGALSLSEDMKVMIFQSVHNYFNENNRITVDGISGDQTAKAVNSKKALGYEVDKDLSRELKSYYKTHLNKAKKFLSDFKSSNDINNVRMLQVILCLSGATNVKPDGVIGDITKAAMNKKLGTDNVAQIKDDKLKAVIDEAISNVGATSNMGFSVKGIKTSSEASGVSSEKTKTSSEAPGVSSEKTNTSSGKAGSKGGYDAIFVAGSTSVVSMENQLKSFKDGFGKDKNVATFLYTGTPYGQKQTIAQVLAENPKIPAFLFSAGVWRASDVVSNGNADLNKVYIIHPHGDNKPLVDRATAAGLPIKNVFVSKYYGHGSNIPNATPTATNDHMDALTEVARDHSV